MSTLTTIVIFPLSAPMFYGGTVPLMDSLFPEVQYENHQVRVELTLDASCPMSSYAVPASAVHISMPPDTTMAIETGGAAAAVHLGSALIMDFIHFPMELTFQLHRQGYLAVAASRQGCAVACRTTIDGEEVPSCGGFVGSRRARQVWERIEAPLSLGIKLSGFGMLASYLSFLVMSLAYLGELAFESVSRRLRWPGRSRPAAAEPRDASG